MFVRFEMLVRLRLRFTIYDLIWGLRIPSITQYCRRNSFQVRVRMVLLLNIQHAVQFFNVSTRLLNHLTSNQLEYQG